MSAAALALSAVAAVSVAVHSARGAAPFPYMSLVTPFPSPTASASPVPTASPSPHHTVPAQSGAMTHPSKMPVMAATVAPSPTMTTAPAASPSTSATQPTVIVSYLVVSDGNGELEGEVKVTNTGFSAISGWQIVVALPYDRFTAVSANASGYASNHILVLQPATYADSVPADGTLRVFFTAYGTRTTPELCAFNDIACG